MKSECVVREKRSGTTWRRVSVAVLAFVSCGAVGAIGACASRNSQSPAPDESVDRHDWVQLRTTPEVKLLLPSAQHTLDLVDSPMVVITPTDVYLSTPEGTGPRQEERVAETTFYQQHPRFDRNLFQLLQTHEGHWKRRNPGKIYPPVVLIAADKRVSARAVGAAYYTAALAGHWWASFVVAGEQEHRRLSTAAIVPDYVGPPSLPASQRILLASLESDTVTLRWREPDGVVKPAGWVNMAALPGRRTPRLQGQAS